jgi:DNA-binding MarR family transcriptional regulator
MSKDVARGAGGRRLRAHAAVSADQREKEQTAAIAEREREPLRRKILAALTAGPATPTQLGKRFDSPTPSVNRILKEFREAGLVIREGDAADRRRRHYSLTAAGEAELNRYTAFGERQEPPPSLTDEETRSLLQSALHKGVRIRRQENRLGEAASRFRAVIREAEKAGERELALEAMVELAKTLRQDRQHGEQEQLNAAYGELATKLNEIAIGNAGDYRAELALPAAAHLRYVLGRAGDRREDDLQTREAHLISARELYGQLFVNSDPSDRAGWFARRAWSIISLAGNLRKQTRLETALRMATVAKRDFDVLEDDYGRAHCLIMFGFCLRLLGEFLEAAVCLERAYDLGRKHSFERISADALMQMGEVKRCLGELDEAQAMLSEALDRSDQMSLWVTQAFAQSALGAVEFQLERFGEADEKFQRADELFGDCRHAEGIVLNTRRKAAVARRIAEASSKPSYVAAERLIESAYEGYEKLHSPAGIVACGIEEGWVQMMRKGGRVQPVVARLKAVLADRNRREFLELDPWVPQLLCRFAREAEDGDLVETSEAVLTAAQEKLCERGTRGVEQVAEVMKEVKLEEEDELDESTAEMGGEARRDPSAFEELLEKRERKLEAVAA